MDREEAESDPGKENFAIQIGMSGWHHHVISSSHWFSNCQTTLTATLPTFTYQTGEKFSQHYELFWAGEDWEDIRCSQQPITSELFRDISSNTSNHARLTFRRTVPFGALLPDRDVVERRKTTGLSSSCQQKLLMLY